jgi:hypothetical protein
MNSGGDSGGHDPITAPVGLQRVLERLSATENVHFSVTIAAPPVNPAQVFMAAPGEPAILWSSHPDCYEVGLGVFAGCSGSGPDRLLSIIDQASRTAFGFQCVGVGAAACEAKFFGGYSAPNSGAGDWHDFPEAEFSVPRILYRSVPQGASLTLFVARSEIEDAAQRDRYIEQLRRLTTVAASC